MRPSLNWLFLQLTTEASETMQPSHCRHRHPIVGTRAPLSAQAPACRCMFPLDEATSAGLGLPGFAVGPLRVATRRPQAPHIEFFRHAKPKTLKYPSPSHRIVRSH